MQANIQFDNILITNSPEEASAFAEKTWRPKYILEIKLEEELKKTPVREPGPLRWWTAAPPGSHPPPLWRPPTRAHVVVVGRKRASLSRFKPTRRRRGRR